MRTLMLVEAVPSDNGGMRFTAHGTRFEQYMGIGLDGLRDLLPDNTVDCDVRRWNGSSPQERESALGLEGLFHSAEEVDRYVSGLAAPK